MTLYDELEERLVECCIDGENPESGFLPLSDLNDKITIDSIRTELSSTLRDDCLPERILRQAKKVFAILVLIEEPEAIEALVEKDKIMDEDLPLSRMADSKRHKDYNTLHSAGGNKVFSSFTPWPKRESVKQFLKRQWEVQAPVLESIGQHLTIETQCPFPFTEIIRRNAGYSGFVYQSKLHPAHQQVFKTGRIPYVALKEVKSQVGFQKEKENLERVQSLQNKHLIKLIATCTKKPLFYFIFPWADGGNLKEFWRREDSKPRTPELILWSLQQMLGLVDGLKALHGQNIRHGDLKPQNILHFKKSDRETIQTGGKSMLVITDVGVSKFHKEMTILRHDGTAEKAATVSYEAPEAEPDRLQGLPRSRKYDMWSMGCIFLEFTIWIVYSYNAVRRFRGRRSAKGVPTTTAGTFFRHNERGAVEIHASVAMAIETLLQDTRCEHTALEDLIMLIKDHLLQVDVHQRAEATDLYERLAKIVRAAENNSAYLCKIIASPPLTPKFFRSRRDSNSSRTSSSDMSPSQDDSSDRSASSPNVSSFDES